MTAAFPPHPTDDPARMAAVLAYIARKIAEEMRRTRRRKPEAMTTARLLAALPEAPLPPAIEMLFSDAAMRDIPILTPDFSPDFLSHVEQWPLVVRRAEAAEILDVSLDWFDRNVDRLMREACFPAPRSATGQKRWSLICLRTLRPAIQLGAGNAAKKDSAVMS